MPTFEELQQNINAERDAVAAQNKHVAELKQQLQAKTDTIQQLERANHANNGQANEQQQQLKVEQQQLAGQLKKASGLQKERLLQSSELYKGFREFSDPRKNISQFSIQTPILLFPIRIETRFKKVTTSAGLQQDQLWIRVYPDDCLIDSFEEKLTLQEVDNGLLYWQKIYEAGGDTLLERGAWRLLVNAYGSGRALHIRSITQPQNLAAAPVKVNPTDVFLVVSSLLTPSPAQQTALENYWRSVWLHAGDALLLKKDWEDFILAIGDENAATDLSAQFTPFNIEVSPPPDVSKANANVSIQYLQPFDATAYTAKKQSWTEAPQVNLLPERFVFTAYQNNAIVINELGNQIPYPLYVAPNPGLPAEDQFTKDADGTILMPDELKWLTDFDTAIANGMGIKLNLTAAQAGKGFDKLIVLGTRLSANETKGQQLVEDLFDKLYKSRDGLQILPQGTPTNNTEDTASYHQSVEDSDTSFELLKKGDLFAFSSETKQMKDGQYLAKALGIDPMKLMSVPNAGGTDMADAENINTVLWPATLGYFFEGMLQPVLSPAAIGNTQYFFNKYVSGRGKVPAIKIGKQPYGILPTTAFSSIEWFQKINDNFALAAIKENSFPAFLSGLYTLLLQIDKDWEKLLPKVSYVGKPESDAHQDLLNVLGLSASSVEFYARNAVSAKQVKSLYAIVAASYRLRKVPFNPGKFKDDGMDLLKELGYIERREEATPAILEKYFFGAANVIKNNIIDDQPLSPDKPIRNYTTDNKNYIEWLLEKCSTSYNAFAKAEGFTGNARPTALFFQSLYHALDLSFGHEALEQNMQKNLIDMVQVNKLKIDPDHLNIADTAVKSKLPYQYLSETNAAVTGNNSLKVSDFITQSLKTTLVNSYLSQQLTALATLKDKSTAALERLFAEHLDLCSYRLDAWQLALINYRLENLRQPSSNEEPHKGGLYMGAFGWIENLRSENKTLTPHTIADPALKDFFIKNPDEVVFKDNTNGGYIAAPSLNHATTASILRNAYTSGSNPDAFQVNLSSERVRKALGVIEGIRNGQSLSALLGYYFEKGLHSNYPGIELDYFMYQIRRAFPLVVNKIKSTAVDNTDADAIEAIEARNVTDGLALIKHIEKTGNDTYPFGFSYLNITGLTGNQINAIKAEINNIRDINDAVADVALAESVHQVVNGNYDTANATLEAYSKGTLPNIPEVVQTPRKGYILTHRVAIHLETNVAVLQNLAALYVSPKAKAAPALNQWLGTVIPPLNEITCRVAYTNNAGNQQKTVAANNLSIEPIDLLYLLNNTDDQTQSSLDELITKFILQFDGTTLLDTPIEIDYITQRLNEFSFFEIAPLIFSLQNIVFNAKPILPADISFGSEASKKTSGILSVTENILGLTTAKNNINSILTIPLANLINIGTPLFNTLNDEAVPDKTIVTNAIINQLKPDFIDPFLTIASTLHQYGIDQTGFGFIFTTQKDIVLFIKNHFKKHQQRWNDLLLKYNATMSDYDDLLPAQLDEKFLLLQKAEASLTNQLSDIFTPATLNNYENHITNSVLVSFNNKLLTINNIVNHLSTDITPLYNDAKAVGSLANFTSEDIDFAGIQTQLIIFANTIYAQALALQKSLAATMVKVGVLFTEIPTLTNPQKQLDKTQEITKLLFSDAFKIIPTFTLPAFTASEFQNAFNNKNKLLEHLTRLQPDGTQLSEFPQEDWLYGVARVREKMQHLERIVMMADAFKANEPVLHPLQLPFDANESWLAMEYPEDFTINTDKLLYTAHFVASYTAADELGGLLIDEWTEVIPDKEEDIGIAFHYDKPNSEPVQALLLALSPKATGNWQWNDLLNVVNETLEMAKKRAIEPTHIDTLDYNKFLPAVVAAKPGQRYFSSLNYTIANLIKK